MIRIAILGDIGAGKSFVSKQFNCPLFNADKEVAKIRTKRLARMLYACKVFTE